MPEAINKPAPSLEEATENRRRYDDGQSDAPHKIRAALLKTFFTGLSWTAASRGLTAVGTAARYVVFVLC